MLTSLRPIHRGFHVVRDTPNERGCLLNGSGGQSGEREPIGADTDTGTSTHRRSFPQDSLAHPNFPVLWIATFLLSPPRRTWADAQSQKYHTKAAKDAPTPSWCHGRRCIPVQHQGPPRGRDQLP